MSMMGTLAKVAIGIALAKGADALMERSRAGAPQAGRGTVFGGANASLAQARSGGGLEDMIGSVLSGKGGGGSLGGLLDGLARGGSGQGGLNDLIGALTGGKGGGAGGLGDLLGSLAGGQQASGATTGGEARGGLGGLLASMAGGGAASGARASFPNMLDDALANDGEPTEAPTPDQELVAALMLRAMIQAAKSDGKLDEGEKQKILGRLGQVSKEEMEFVNAELAASVDAAALARQVPRGLEPQIYTMAVMGIVLDDQKEARFLHELATALGLEPDEVNHIHAELGVPRLYA